MTGARRGRGLGQEGTAPSRDLDSGYKKGLQSTSPPLPLYLTPDGPQGGLPADITGDEETESQRGRNLGHDRSCGHGKASPPWASAFTSVKRKSPALRLF